MNLLAPGRGLNRAGLMLLMTLLLGCAGGPPNVALRPAPASATSASGQRGASAAALAPRPTSRAPAPATARPRPPGATREDATPQPATETAPPTATTQPSPHPTQQPAPTAEAPANEEQAPRAGLDWGLLPSPEPTAAAVPTAEPAPTQAPDPRAQHAPAMRGGALDGIVVEALPRYSLRMRVDPAARLVSGSQELYLPNGEGQELHTIVLRLYLNFPPDLFDHGANLHMDVGDVTVDGKPAASRLLAQETALEIALPQPLRAGAATTIALSFSATMRPEDDGTWALPFYYPTLAVYEDGAWRMDVTNYPDSVYAESALYQAEISLPSELTLASAGTIVGATAGDDGFTSYSIVTGPAREFAFSAGHFALASASGGASGDVRVNVYSAPDGGLDGQQIADVAAAALAAFDQRFGSYPYAELDLHLLPGDFDGGDEHPGLILVYSAGPVDAGARYVTAHEVAHQWWYAVVGNDIYHQPWLDEAFAQYSAIVYAEDVEGPAAASAHWEREVARRYADAVREGDLPVGWGIARYPSFNVYYHTVYGKGAVFLRTLRQELGDEAFFAALRRYYAERRHGVGTTADVLRGFEETSGHDLGDLFSRWVG